MGNFSDYILFPQEPEKVRQGIKQLGFVLDTEIPADPSKLVRVDTVQAFGTSEKARARTNIGAQTQDGALDALAALTYAANKGIVATGPDAFATFDLSTFARTILDDANGPAVLVTIGAQATSTKLDALAGLTLAANKGIYATGASALATFDLTAFARTILDDADAATLYATLGVIPDNQIPARLQALAPQFTDANALTENGVFRVTSGALNTPVAFNGLIWNAVYVGNNGAQLFIRASATVPDTYVRTMAGGVWSPWKKVYRADNILANVAQTGGEPTGGIIERGSNSNGNYIRFADGTMICSYVDPTPVTTTGVTGSLFRGVPPSYTFPLPFIAEPEVLGSGKLVSGTSQGWVTPLTRTSSSCQVRVWSNFNDCQWNPGYVAIGRWF